MNAVWILIAIAAFFAGGAIGIIGAVMFVREVRSFRDEFLKFVEYVVRRLAPKDCIDADWEDCK